MGQNDSRKKVRIWEKESFSFILSLISVSIVFIFLGYLMGQYGLQMLEQKSPVTSSVPQQSASINQQIEKRLEELSANEQAATATSSSANTSSSSQQQSSTVAAGSALYRVQVGAFSQRANAQRLVNSLRELGYEAFITDGPPYRVQTGAFSSSESAQRYADELIKRGFEVTIVRPDNP